MTSKPSKRDTPYRDWCVGENDTCAREIDFDRAVPGKDGLCTKHHILKGSPDPRKRRL